MAEIICGQISGDVKNLCVFVERLGRPFDTVGVTAKITVSTSSRGEF